jgi:hypothetical protein
MLTVINPFLTVALAIAASFAFVASATLYLAFLSASLFFASLFFGRVHGVSSYRPIHAHQKHL